MGIGFATPDRLGKDLKPGPTLNRLNITSRLRAVTCFLVSSKDYFVSQFAFDRTPGVGLEQPLGAVLP